MIFCVTFLDADAKSILNYDKIWISGNAMNTIITPTLVKRKFVFDKTIL